MNLLKLCLILARQQMFDKYKIVKNAISAEEAKLLAASLLIGEPKDSKEDTVQVVGSTIVHGQPAMEALMLKLLPTMQRETELELIPTYSFARIYREGDSLDKHKDRPACEISCTLTLGYVADKIWPIFADESGPVLLDHGDILIYRGCEVEHWREPLEGTVWVQVFLHYVDANGPHKEWALDKREVGPFYETVYDTFLRS